MALIELKKISKRYQMGKSVEVLALKNLSLKIESGDFVAIMGSSGSGKSTLLSILGLLDKPSEGEYFLLQKELSKLKDHEYAKLRNRFFGFIFQTFNLLPKINVIKNAMLPFIYSNHLDITDQERVNETLKKVGLLDRLKHRPSELSGGQQQRVAIVRALANNPLVILADEPTGNLDSKSSAEIMELLKELNESGVTIIMVTHEEEMAKNAHRILRLKDGEIISDERLKQITTQKMEDADNFSKKTTTSFFSFNKVKNYLTEGLSSILGNKLRSFLSILGVMVGVAAVITMLALGTGAREQVDERLSSLGTNLLLVRTSRRSRGISMGNSSITRFNFNDLKALQKIPGISYVVPYTSGRAQVVYQNKNWNTSILGTTLDYQKVREALPETGRFFSQEEDLSRAKVAILGQNVVSELFGDHNPLGKWIKINRVNFKVIGVLQEKGVSGFSNLDDQVIIPVRTAMYRLLGEDYISYFDVQVKERESMSIVQAEIISTINTLHRLPESQKDSIYVRNMAEIQQVASEMVGALSFLLGAIGAVSLLVGGIGIMNIMLVMVMERTREIGIRKALGAERKDIISQFLTESVLICLLGGLMGILFGIGISLILSHFAGWNTIITLSSILLAFIFSVLVGIIFGIWPAIRASRLLPVVALRYE